MKLCLANYSKKGQIKIQQMAFVLVALMIFFAIVSLFYFSIRIENLREDSGFLSEQEASEIVRKLATTPEFNWGAGGCNNCIDLDKVLILKERKSYDGFWDLDLLKIEKVYPKEDEVECTKANYPNCTTINIINSEDFGSASDAFVSICRWEASKGGYHKCEIGRIFASGGGINE